VSVNVPVDVFVDAAVAVAVIGSSVEGAQDETNRKINKMIP